MRSRRHALDIDFYPPAAAASAVESIGPVYYEQFRPPAWYAVVRYKSGHTLHSSPWQTRLAAEYASNVWRKRVVLALVKRGDTGNGDTCPLVPEHGNMWVLSGGSTQWCPNQYHTARGTASRAAWPLNGLEAAVREHWIATEKGKAAAFPDLSELEVL